MKTRIYILTATGRTLLQQATVKSFSIKFGGGNAIISLPKSAEETTASNMSYFNRIQILGYNNATKTFTPVYLGYISSINDGLTSFDVGLQPIHKLRRHSGIDETFSGQADILAMGLLDTINTEHDTYITEGESNLTTSISIEENQSKIQDCWESMAEAGGGEWDITPWGVFNFVDHIGEDKSSTVQLRHRQGEPSTNTLEVSRLQADSKDMANRIFGVCESGRGGTKYYSTAEDVSLFESQGIIERKIRFPSARSQATLDTMTENLLERVKGNTSDIVVISKEKRTVENLGGRDITTGLDFFDVELGDYVHLSLDTPTLSVDESKRVLEKRFTQDQNGAKITLTLSRLGATKTVLEGLGESEKQLMLKRIQELETMV